MRFRHCTLLGPLLLACGQGAKEGQSGSEFNPSSSDDGTPQAAQYDECPCVRLEGRVPLLGTVTSWESTLLTLDVNEVLIDDPPSGSPVTGERLLGIYLGDLPCYWGTYLPERGDEVVAYVLPDAEAPAFCCEVAACNEQCEDEDGAESVDECLASCQRPASDSCAAERAGLSIVGRMVITPFDDVALDLARAEDGTEYTVTPDDLSTIYSGGDTCRQAVGSADATLEGLPRGGSFPWKESCSAE